MIICMSNNTSDKFNIHVKEKLTKESVVSCFVQDADGDGGGWGYDARLQGETVHVDFSGQIRVKHMPVLITLMETAVKEDKERNTEFESPSYDFTTYEKEEEEDFRKDIAESVKAEVGIDSQDFWIANGASVDEGQRSISAITLLRAGERYISMEIGYPAIYFNAHQLEAMLEFLKTCYEVFKDEIRPY